MEASCQCRAISFTTPLPQPLALYICHCEGCRKQTGSAFGTSAIFPRFPLPKSDLLRCYKRPTGAGTTLYCYFCQTCGTRLIHATPNKNVVSVKGGCLNDLDWGKAIHIWTKNAMVPIPEGSETHSEESEHTDYGQSQEMLDQPGILTGSGDTSWRAAVSSIARNGTADKEGLCELSGTHSGFPGAGKMDYAADQHHLL